MCIRDSTHPERYLQIEQADKDWQIAQAASGTAYFIVKAPHSARLAIRIRTEAEGLYNAKIISLLELLEDCLLYTSIPALLRLFVPGNHDLSFDIYPIADVQRCV